MLHQTKTEDVTGSDQYGSWYGTVATCTCGWKSSWKTRDGSAECDAANHMKSLHSERMSG